MTAGPPAAIVIGAHVWRVDAGHDAAERCIEAGDRGRTMAERQLIEVDGRRPPSGVAETLLHEVLHALLDDAGADVVPKLTADNLEAVVTLLAPRLLHFIRANPAAVDYLVTAVGAPAELYLEPADG